MKMISSIFVCFVLSVIVEGNMLAAAFRGGIEPIILSFGAAFAALGQNSESSSMFESLNNYKERYKEWLKERPGSYPKEDKEREKPQNYKEEEVRSTTRTQRGARNYKERYREWYREKHGYDPEEGDLRAELFKTEEEKT